LAHVLVGEPDSTSPEHAQADPSCRKAQMERRLEETAGAATVPGQLIKTREKWMTQNLPVPSCAAVLLFMVKLLWAGAAQAQLADTVLFNGKVLTGDKDFSVTEALAIDHGRVLAAGTSQAMRRLAGEQARLIDLVLLSQKAAVPGIFESFMEANPTEARGLGWGATDRKTLNRVLAAMSRRS
jgi:hypothetical protein